MSDRKAALQEQQEALKQGENALIAVGILQRLIADIISGEVGLTNVNISVAHEPQYDGAGAVCAWEVGDTTYTFDVKRKERKLVCSTVESAEE